MSKLVYKRLGDVVNFKRGYDLPQSQRKEGIYPVISSSGISGYHSEYKQIGIGLITGRYGTLGEMYYFEGAYWPHNTTLYATTFFDNHPKYIYYLLKCLGNLKTSDKSTVPGINRNDLHEINIPFISNKDKQIIIANLLTSLDAKIELNNRINAELEAMAKTLYDYWFVQFDFPTSAEYAASIGKPELKGKPYKSSGGKMVYNKELKREIPEGWAVQTVGTFSNVKKGTLITEKTANTKGNIKVVSAGLDFSYFHDKSNYSENTITISASGASAGFINFWREPIFACDCTTVRGNTDAETLFLHHFLKMRQEYIFHQARGSAQPHVYPKDIEGLKIEIPTKELFIAFGKQVLSSNEKISNNIRQNQQLTSLRDWLLPMLMNGQVSVRIPHTNSIKEAEEKLDMAAEPKADYGK